MLTCKYVLHSRPKQDGSVQVRLRLTKGGVSRFVDTGLSVRADKDWNPEATEGKANWLRAAAPDHKLRNERLKLDILWAWELGKQHPSWTIDQLQERVKLGRNAVLDTPQPAEKTELLAYLEQDIRRQTPVLVTGSLRMWNALYNKLRRYAGEEGWPLSELTPGRVREFYAWLVSDPRCGVNHARMQMSFLKTLVGRAVDDGLVEYHKNPFRKLTFPKEERKERPRLTVEQTLHFLSAPLPVTPRYPYANLPKMLLARTTWLLQYLLAGSRIGDVLELRWRNVQQERVVFTERKTGKKKSVKRNDLLDAVLHKLRREGQEADDYVLPYLQLSGCKRLPLHSAALTDAILNATRSINHGLRLLCRGIGLPEMTSHSARHTLLFHGFEALGNITMVQQLANHSSEAITRQYLRRLSEAEQSQDQTMEAILRSLNQWNNGGTTRPRMGEDEAPLKTA